MSRTTTLLSGMDVFCTRLALDCMQHRFNVATTHNENLKRASKTKSAAIMCEQQLQEIEVINGREKPPKWLHASAIGKSLLLSIEEHKHSSGASHGERPYFFPGKIMQAKAACCLLQGHQ
eukprot:1160166-Pelagomonas_calceolata.AAC.9